MSITVFITLVVVTGLERVAELVVSARNAAWSFARGGAEFGRRHFPAMVALHLGLLVGCVVEVIGAGRPFIPWIGWPMVVLVLASQALRWWCIASLGRQWNTRVIVVRGMPLVTRGPYRWLRHPNYLAVIIEGLALPLVHSAWVTALVFSLLNAFLLFVVRIPCEERGLATVIAAPVARNPRSSW